MLSLSELCGELRPDDMISTDLSYDAERELGMRVSDALGGRFPGGELVTEPYL